MAKTGCVLHINPLLFCVCAPKICCVFAKKKTPQHLKKTCLFLHKDHYKAGGWEEGKGCCYSVVTESSRGWQRNHLSQPCSLLKLSSSPHSVSNRLTTTGAPLSYFIKYRVLVQVSYSALVYYYYLIFHVRWHWCSWNEQACYTNTVKLNATHSGDQEPLQQLLCLSSPPGEQHCMDEERNQRQTTRRNKRQRKE